MEFFSFFLFSMASCAMATYQAEACAVGALAMTDLRGAIFVTERFEGGNDHRLALDTCV